MTQTRHAIILVAGEGKRLRPFTDSNPKCFARVAGHRILDNALLALAANGCENVRVVTGHMSQLIRATITERFAGMSIQYVENPDYQNTNSMFSLALGLEGLDAPAWVLEGDVFIEPAILGLPAQSPIAWFVDSATRQLDGAYVEADTSGRARSLQIIRDLRLLQPNQSKSIGILKLSREGARNLSSWLREGIAAGRQNVYYDLILGDHMNDAQVEVVDVAGRKWFEIDSAEDLQNAERLFA